jgi:hypothetical protein
MILTKSYIDLFIFKFHLFMIRNEKSYKSRNIQLFVLVLSVLAVLLTQQVQQANASTNVFSAGWNAGKNDRMDGNSYNDTCPDELTSDAQCVSWKAGYGVGWNVEGGLHGNDQPRDTPPDICDRDADEC